MAYFDGIKEGDRVYDLVYGWGMVANISILYEDIGLPISVAFRPKNSIIAPTPLYYSFTMDGKRNHIANQTLFWDEVIITPPVRPKQDCIQIIPETIKGRAVESLKYDNIGEHWLVKFIDGSEICVKKVEFVNNIQKEEKMDGYIETNWSIKSSKHSRIS